MRKVIAGNITLSRLKVAMAGQQSPSNLKQMVLSAYQGVSSMQTLMVVSRLFQDLLNGNKRSTIRFGELHIEKGYLRYECEGQPSQASVVWVTRCTYMPLNKAAAFCGMEAMWPPMIMLRGMREHYPLIQLSDTVQVVEHYTPEQTKNL